MSWGHLTVYKSHKHNIEFLKRENYGLKGHTNYNVVSIKIEE